MHLKSREKLVLSGEYTLLRQNHAVAKMEKKNLLHRNTLFFPKLFNIVFKGSKPNKLLVCKISGFASVLTSLLLMEKDVMASS